MLLLYGFFNHPHLIIQVARESSVPVLTGLSHKLTGAPCNRIDEVHSVDPFHSLDNWKSQFASIYFDRNSEVHNVRNGAVIELSVLVSIKGCYCLDKRLLLSTHSLNPCLWGEADHPAFGPPASSSITPAGLTTNPGVTMWCVCRCS